MKPAFSRQGVNGKVGQVPGGFFLPPGRLSAGSVSRRNALRRRRTGCNLRGGNRFNTAASVRRSRLLSA